jgi:putative endonuclease
MEQHLCGLGGAYTSKRLPVDLVFYEESASLKEALDRERQLKRWSAQKKAALVRASSRR